MIRGDKPSGYGVTVDENFRKIEVEFRQCQHCQMSWEYKKGSGNTIGFCTYCNGLLCNKCVKITWKKTEKRCLPFYDTALENSDKYFLDPTLGIYLRR